MSEKESSEYRVSLTLDNRWLVSTMSNAVTRMLFCVLELIVLGVADP